MTTFKFVPAKFWTNSCLDIVWNSIVGSNASAMALGLGIRTSTRQMGEVFICLTNESYTLDNSGRVAAAFAEVTLPTHLQEYVGLV